MENKNNYNILSSTLILSLGVLISRIIGFVYRIPIQKILGDEGNGLYGEAYQIYTIILTLTAIAMPSALSKVIAESEAVGNYKQSKKTFHLAVKYASIGAVLLGGLIFFGADWISEVAFPGDDVGNAIRIFAPTAIVATVVASYRGYFQGLGDMKPTALSQILEQIVNVIVSVALAYILVKVSLQLGVIGSCIGTTAGALVALFTLFMYNKSINNQRKISKLQVQEVESEKIILQKLLHILIPTVISTSVFSIMTLIDYSMISKLLPSAIYTLQQTDRMYLIPVADIEKLDVATIVLKLKGQYSFQYNTFINIPVSLILQLAVASIPSIAVDVATYNTQGVNQKINMIMKVGLLFAVPASIAFLLFGVPIIQMILGKTASGGELLAVGGISLIAITIAQLTAGILQGIGKARMASTNAMIACGVKVILNFVLMSVAVLNIYSIVISTFICYIIYAVLNMFYLYKTVKIRIAWKEVLVKPLVCSMIMGIVSYTFFRVLGYVLTNVRVSMLLTILVAVFIYYILAHKLGIMLPELEQMVEKILKKLHLKRVS